MSREYIGCALFLDRRFIIRYLSFALNDRVPRNFKSKKKEERGGFVLLSPSSFPPLLNFVLLFTFRLFTFFFFSRGGEETLLHQFFQPSAQLGYLLLPSSSRVQERLTLTNCKFEMHNSLGK